MTNFNRYPLLDLFRAIAALSVFIHHFYQQNAVFFDKNYASPFLSFLGGWGVTLFFVISGFCIHHSRLLSVEKKDTFDLRQYFVRRFFRIYPGFVVCVLLFFLVGQYFISNLVPNSKPIAIFMHLGLISSFFVEYSGAINHVLWSVVAECHFYILYAILWRKFSGIKSTIIMLLLSLFIGAATFILSVALFPQGAERLLVQKIFLASWWIWCLGVLVAELLHRRIFFFRSMFGNRTALLVITIISFGIAYLPFAYSIQFQRFALPFLCAGLIFFALQDTYSLNHVRFLYFIGLVSYSLYLYHPLALLIGAHLELDLFWQTILVFPLGITFASLAYYLIEMPGVELGKIVFVKLNAFNKCAKY
jgi:peptidoglycan/LPS O-acetylase OafA/YrhL